MENKVGEVVDPGRDTSADKKMPPNCEISWERSEWMNEGGSNCTPLEPQRPGLVKTLPPPDVSVFEHPLPQLKDEVRAVNRAYLEITTGLAENKWVVVGIAIMVGPFALASIPYLIYTFAVRREFGEMMGLDLALIVFTLFFFGMYVALFSIAFLSPEDEPVRFSRHEQRVYCYRARRIPWLGMELFFPGKCEVKVYSWKNCRAEIVRKIVASESSVRRDCFLELAALDPTTQKVVERFRIGDRDVHSDFSTRILLWETIRRYMELGPAAIPPTPLRLHRGSLVDCIEDFNPFSIPVKSAPGAQRVVGYVLGGLVWIASLVVLTAVFSRWISIKVSRRVDWGSLEGTVFKVDPNDPALHRSPLPQDAAPDLWAQELSRRQRAAWLWLLSCLFQAAWFWWFLSGPGYYE